MEPMDTPQNLTVFGATGSIGRLVVDQALESGHHVTAFTRDAHRVQQRHDLLRVVTGDVTDPDDCLPAVTGADAVIITLGNGRRGVVREAGTRAVVEAMRRSGVERLVCQSTLGVGRSRDHLDLVWRYLMFGLLLRPAYADHVRQEEVVTGSDLDWTIVRPSAFADERIEGVRHGFDGSQEDLTLKVARSDVATFLLSEARAGAASRGGRFVSLSA